ncbi:hypothetical protein HN903_01625 [archaeon]|jgi:hypothetical protein|nr:hypothetical protein [archaeon]MBT7128432.1 hypothetical protein [archaeon]
MGEKEDGSLEAEDLPRIVVDDDSIVVLEKGLIEKVSDAVSDDKDVFGETEFEEFKVGFKNDYEVEKVDDEALRLGDVSNDDAGSEVDEVFLAPSLGLEETVGGIDEQKKDGDDFYKASAGVGELYDSKMYEDKGVDVDDVKSDYESSVEQDVGKGFVDVEAESRRGKSMLEVAGFVDVEAESRRDKKRKATW